MTPLQVPVFEVGAIEESGSTHVARALIVGQAEHGVENLDGLDHLWTVQLSEDGETEEFLFFRPERLGQPTPAQLREMIEQMGRELQHGRGALEQFRMRRQPHPGGQAILLPY